MQHTIKVLKERLIGDTVQPVGAIIQIDGDDLARRLIDCGIAEKVEQPITVNVNVSVADDKVEAQAVKPKKSK